MGKRGPATRGGARPFPAAAMEAGLQRTVEVGVRCASKAERTSDSASPHTASHHQVHGRRPVAMEFLGGEEERGDAVAGAREARRITHWIMLAIGGRGEGGAWKRSRPSRWPARSRISVSESSWERDEKGNGD